MVYSVIVESGSQIYTLKFIIYFMNIKCVLIQRA